MKRLRKLVLPLVFVVSLAAGTAIGRPNAQIQCSGCDDWIITQSRGFLSLCACDSRYCYYNETGDCAFS
jgi:hypothetical protein